MAGKILCLRRLSDQIFAIADRGKLLLFGNVLLFVLRLPLPRCHFQRTTLAVLLLGQSVLGQLRPARLRQSALSLQVAANSHLFVSRSARHIGGQLLIGMKPINAELLRLLCRQVVLLWFLVGRQTACENISELLVAYLGTRSPWYFCCI